MDTTVPVDDPTTDDDPTADDGPPAADGDGASTRGASDAASSTVPFVPERAQEAGGSWYAGPLRRRVGRLPGPLRRALRSKVVRIATTPHGPDPYLRMLNPLWSLDATRALLVEHRRETHDVSTLRFDPGPGWGPARAGQHVRIDLDLDGRRVTRYFSISSPPAADGTFTCTVKAHPDGRVSRFLHTHARPGLVIEVSPPRGEFVLPDPRPARLLLVSGGSGITPVTAMLRQLVAEGADTEVAFLHYARGPEDHIFGDELTELGRRPGIEVHTVHTRSGTAGDGHPTLRGRLERSHLDHVAPDWAQLPAFVCGPPAMLDRATDLWEEAGAADHLHVERFTFDAPAPVEGGGGGTVRLTASDVQIEDDGRPLLVQAEDAGLEPDFGCRMGICKTCTVRKVQGTTQNLSTGEVSRDDGTDIQICVSVALGDTELDL